MGNFCARFLRVARLLTQGLTTFALIMPASHAGAPSKQEAVSPQTQFLGCVTLDGSFKEAKCLQLAFQGEVSNGQAFECPIGGNLLFRLNSRSMGWTIEITPQASGGPERSEYVWVVTPPYRSWNPRYLDTSYGMSASEAVHNTPREFNFVLNDTQYKRALNLVELASMSHPPSDHRSPEELQKETNEAIAALLEFPVATGRLWILDSRIAIPAAKDDPGSIEWIKFRVILNVPCGFAAAKSTNQFSVDGSSCGSSARKKNG